MSSVDHEMRTAGSLFYKFVFDYFVKVFILATIPLLVIGGGGLQDLVLVNCEFKEPAISEALYEQVTTLLLK